MQALILLAVIGFATCGKIVIPDTIPLLSQEMIDYINSMNTTWKAGPNFEGKSLEYVKGLFGGFPASDEYRLPEISHTVTQGLPDRFDARQKWGNCRGIAQIRDQGACASCWAIAAANCMSDRYCIHSNGQINIEVSTQNLLSCCSDCGAGCKGGRHDRAWQYWVDQGLVTGGTYNSQVGCQPYVFGPCDHSGSGPSECRVSGETPQCVQACQPGYNNSYNADKRRGRTAYRVPSDVGQMMAEIYNNGPVEAGFMVYADFPSYRTGIYQRHHPEKQGGHTIRVLGWGTEQGVPYWLCANTFNTNWGENGYFKILRGSNECNFEGDVIAGMP